MRTFFSIGRLFLVAITVFMLASCASHSSGTIPKPLDSSCHSWCHNGWCSEHCDDGDGN